MNFIEDTVKDSNLINKYQNGTVYVNQTPHQRPFLLTKNEVIIWNADVNNLNHASCQQILTLEPKIILIGTGETHIFLKPENLQPFYKNQIGFEIMSTRALCNTFNVLVAEYRKVVAAVFP